MNWRQYCESRVLLSVLYIHVVNSMFLHESILLCLSIKRNSKRRDCRLHINKATLGSEEEVGVGGCTDIHIYSDTLIKINRNK